MDARGAGDHCRTQAVVGIYPTGCPRQRAFAENGLFTGLDWLLATSTSDQLLEGVKLGDTTDKETTWTALTRWTCCLARGGWAGSEPMHTDDTTYTVASRPGQSVAVPW